MSKEKLQEIIVESFLNGKIDENRFFNMSEKVDSLEEASVKQIVKDLKLSAAGFGIGIVAGSLIGIGIGEWRKHVQKNLMIGKKYCKYITANISDPIDRKKKNLLCQISNVNKVIANLKSKLLTSCNKSANPEKCKLKISKFIRYYEKIKVNKQKELKNL